MKKVEDRSKGDKTWKVVTDENGKERHVFEKLKEKYPLLQIGHALEFTYEKQEGSQYPVLIDIKESTVKEAVQKEESSQYSFKYIEQEKMNKRTALMQAVVHSYIDDSDYVVLIKADHYFKWLEQDLIPVENMAVKQSAQGNSQEAQPKPILDNSGASDDFIEEMDREKLIEEARALVKQIGWTKAIIRERLVTAERYKYSEGDPLKLKDTDLQFWINDLKAIKSGVAK